MQPVLSVDVGSTFTKGVLLVPEESEGKVCFRILARASTPTTVAHLAEGFGRVRDSLLQGGEASIHFSSSAKGGLAIAAVGLVPDLTLKTARLTALSAGGRVTSVYAYKLTHRDLEQLEREGPDIVLLAGGTDGGNETYVRHNAAALAGCPGLRERTTVIYAGNQAVADEVVATFSKAGFDVRLAPNILPEMDRVEPDGAREKIREVFLQRIVKGKGLDEIVACTGRDPLPTPYAVLQLVEALSRRAPDFGQFLLVDMGGATTDVYSCSARDTGSERVILRGLPEPTVKRTVEGDLGLRVSAASAARLAQPEPAEAEAFAAHVERVSAEPGFLSTTAAERRFDRLLATACLRQALLRHAGTHRRVFTAAGETFVQTGKDLRGVTRLVGTGGYLSSVDDFPLEEALGDLAGTPGELIPLVPSHLDCLRDPSMLLPLLGNLVRDHEEAAVNTALRSLVASPAPVL